MIKKELRKYVILFAIVIIVSSFSTYIYKNYYYDEKEAFSVNTMLLKLNIVEGGGESVKYITLKNNENKINNFKAYLIGLDNLAEIDSNDFSMAKKSEMELEIKFKDSGKGVGIYPGLLIIESSELKKEIPIVLGVEEKERIFAIAQSSVPQYENVYPGGKLGVNVRMFNLISNELNDIKIEYQVMNLNGDLIFSEEETSAIKGTLEITKLIEMPSSIGLGDYILATSVIYKNHKSSSGYLFSINSKEQKVSVWNFNYFVGIILFFIVLIIVFFFYFVKSRDDLLLELQKQQNCEMRKNIELIKYSRKDAEHMKNMHEREKKLKELESFKKKLIQKIKSKQKKQKKIVKVLKKKGKKDAIKQKLNEWKKEGYKMYDTEKELKKITHKNINSQIIEWKRKGYDTSVFEGQ